MKVSVIVPVYNVEDYLDKCLNSLVNQTLKNIEIIVVNDGSPDNSQAIIDKYTAQYPDFVKGYIKENGGLSDARNYGLQFATGEYIGFVDSDDYVECDMFEKLYNKAISQNFDMVVCDVNSVYPDHTEFISSLVNSDVFDKELLKKQTVNIYPVAWNKIYKKSLFESGVRFKKSVWYEDVEFLYRLFPYVKSIGTVNEPLINYVQRDGAISKTFDKRIFNYIENWNGIVSYYKENGFYDEYFSELEYCYVRYLYNTFINGLAKCGDFTEFMLGVKYAKGQVKEHFPNYRHNKYILKINGIKSLCNSIYFIFFNNLFARIIYIKNFRKKS